MEQKKQTFPLSFSQERLWYHEQSIVDCPVYNIPIAYELNGQLEPKILEKSLETIINRHDVLRTYFLEEEDKPVQMVAPEIEFSLTSIDLRELPAERKIRQAEQIALEDSQTPFNLTEAPLWRFKLLCLEADKYQLLVTIHHIICDHWSLHLLMEELATIYQELSQGKNNSLPPLSRQYGEFTLWQQEWLNGKRRQKQLASWQETLGGDVSSLDLPFDNPMLPTSNYQGTREVITIPSELTHQLKTFSEQREVTLFMTLLTAFEILLYQYNQQEDMIVCSPVSGRHRSETKGMIGYFNNIIPLRINLSGNPSFVDLLGRVRQTALQAYKNMDLPFQTIANLPNLKRVSLARAMFALQHSPKDEIVLSDLTIRYPNFQNVHNGTANFELSLLLEEKEGGLRGVLDYKQGIFEPKTIQALIDQFLALLESLVKEPEQTLLSLPLLRDVRAAKTAKQPTSETPYVAPEKDIERQIAQVWQDVLQVEKVSLYHNFFELGGHSLAIAQVKTQLQALFNQEITVVDLFSYPTVKTLAQYLSQDQNSPVPQFKTIQRNAKKQKQALQRLKQRRKNHG
ncbi:condensation domain-containing protein [Crocosphaera sp.]|uniref:condensation domain-containing protein n=1 Tax=Crocosphaera sp. TaxID=2729996 RepID=UPI003F244B8D|nr:condensation domain-containing protein [Crocosphaera sp.]